MIIIIIIIIIIIMGGLHVRSTLLLLKHNFGRALCNGVYICHQSYPTVFFFQQNLVSLLYIALSSSSSNL